MPIQLERRRMIAIAMAIAIAVCGALLLRPAPSGAEAAAQTAPAAQAAQNGEFWEATLRYAGEFGGFRIAAASGVNDQLNVTYVETPAPTIVFISPGGMLSPPPPCMAGSPQVVTCPVTGLTLLNLAMGPGRDEVQISYSAPGVAGFALNVATGAGNDLIDTFQSTLIRPKISEGAGRGRWSGGVKAEVFYGGAGNDEARAGAGNDRLIGGTGNDRLFGQKGFDFFNGGPGSDFMRGGPGNDRGSGGPGRDNVRD